MVVLFDRRVDPGLQEICEEAAEAAAAARAAAPHSVLAPYRALAQVVAGRLGGPQAANMPLVERIKIALESLNHGGIGTVICPIGDIFLAGPRPRATLFKFLADQLGLKVRVVKGRFYADSDDDARVIIPMDNKDMHLDLMTRPGATSVLAEKLALRASSREQTGAHWRSSSVSEPAEAAPEVPHLPASAAHANTSLGMASVGAGGHQANGLSVEHLAPVAEGQPDDISRPESVEHGINFMSIEEAMQMAAAAAMSGPPGPAAAPLFIPGQLPPAALQQAAPVVTSSLTRSAPGAGFVRMLSRGSSSSLPSAMSGGLMPPSPYEMAPLPAAVRTSMDREGTAAEQAESSQNSEFLAEVGPPALVSDASGQQYIMQPVRASLDYSQLAGWGDGGMPRRDSLGAGPRAGDRVQAKRASSLRPGLPDIPSLGIDGDVEVTLVPGNAPAESGTPTPKLEGTADSMMHWAVMQAAAATAAGAYGGAKQAAESSVPFPQQLRASGVSNVDLSRLYLDGLMQNGSVRMSVPVEFEQRQALLNRTAKVTSSGSTLDDDTSPPLADAKPASRSSGGGVPFPAASMSPGREGHDLAKDNSTDIYTPFSQVQAPLTSAESTVPSVSSESTPHLSNQHSQEPEGEASLRSASATEKSLARALSLHRRGSGQVAQVAARLNSMASAGVSIHSYAGSDEDDTWEIDPSELQFGPRIGMGSYGEVFRGSWRQTDIAIKRLFDQSINPRIVDGFKKEVSIMKRMRHPNIVQFVSVAHRLQTVCLPPVTLLCSNSVCNNVGDVAPVPHSPSLLYPFYLLCFSDGRMHEASQSDDRDRVRAARVPLQAAAPIAGLHHRAPQALANGAGRGERDELSAHLPPAHRAPRPQEPQSTG